MSSDSESPKWKYAAVLSYRGTAYCGWQSQSGEAEAEDGPSIQTTIREILSGIVSEESVSVVGSGRTDSGVHAVGQVAHFTLKRKAWDPAILKKALNSLLPLDIRVLAVYPVPIDFHAQRSAVKKQYSYYFQQGPCALPHLLPFTWWISKTLDVEAMSRAAAYLRGEHDFKPFQAAGAKVGSTVRSILEAEVSIEPVGFPQVPVVTGDLLRGGGELRLVRVRLLGTGFLKQMVRGIAGTLLQVGEGRRKPECIQEILEQGDRKRVGATAPGRALWLERVWYPETFGIQVTESRPSGRQFN